MTRGCSRNSIRASSAIRTISSRAIQPCGVGFFVWSTVLAYNADKLKNAPSGWADFWDTEKFPGKRGLRKGAKYTLEFALMADGVPAKEVYQVLATRTDRTAPSGSSISLPHIQWWEAGAQPLQFPRLRRRGDEQRLQRPHRCRAEREQPTDRLERRHLRLRFLGHPQGRQSQEQARKFIAFTVEPQQQKAYAENIAYGPANTQAVSLLDEKRLAQMPTAPENIADQVAMDVTFWADYGEQLEQRFNAWAAR